MFETKKVFWQVEVEGSPDEMKEMEIEVNATVAEFHEKAQVVRKAVSKVRCLYCTDASKPLRW